MKVEAGDFCDGPVRTLRMCQDGTASTVSIRTACFSTERNGVFGLTSCRYVPVRYFKEQAVSCQLYCQVNKQLSVSCADLDIDVLHAAVVGHVMGTAAMSTACLNMEAFILSCTH